MGSHPLFLGPNLHHCKWISLLLASFWSKSPLPYKRGRRLWKSLICSRVHWNCALNKSALKTVLWHCPAYAPVLCFRLRITFTCSFQEMLPFCHLEYFESGGKKEKKVLYLGAPTLPLEKQNNCSATAGTALFKGNNPWARCRRASLCYLVCVPRQYSVRSFNHLRDGFWVIPVLDLLKILVMVSDWHARLWVDSGRFPFDRG